MADKPNQTPIEKVETPNLDKGTTGEEITPDNKTAMSTTEPSVDVDYKKKFSDSAREVQRLLQEDKLKTQKLSELEAKLAEAGETPSDIEIYSDEGKLLLKKQRETEAKLAKLLEERQLQKNIDDAIEKFSELGSSKKEFAEYVKKYPGVDIETIAKSFLFDQKPESKPRKGLEKPTGGLKTQVTEGWTTEDIARIRETDEKKYLEMIKKGILKGKDIK